MDVHIDILNQYNESKSIYRDWDLSLYGKK